MLLIVPSITDLPSLSSWFPGVLVLFAIIWYFPITSLQRDWVPVATVLCFPISVLIHQTLSATNHICGQKYLRAQNFYLTRKILIGSSSLDQSLKQAQEAQKMWYPPPAIRRHQVVKWKSSPQVHAIIKSSEICWGRWVILKKVVISMEEKYTFIKHSYIHTNKWAVQRRCVISFAEKDKNQKLWVIDWHGHWYCI